MGEVSLRENLLARYRFGIRDLNLILTNAPFYSSGNAKIVEGAGLFIGVSPALEVPEVELVNFEFTGDEGTLTWASVPGRKSTVGCRADLQHWFEEEGEFPLAANAERTSWIQPDLSETLRRDDVSPQPAGGSVGGKDGDLPRRRFRTRFFA